ncbi:transcriptional regulator with XRE-family HTH domain [Kitasatospora sp. MAA19]|uniref:helix-turn-helix domain-containing protein n=1 Tax=Kitasatospora sp. MAA19 TaxID=3035090 RepID=UPI002475B96B|nr:helix-turn-helix transcriptional regulator [Kitasatospora sp. MAA19]MDH6705782.1 transcriptional regulator with XRE-family HTH domain [Kitasatospora sp. MAA19]
MNRKDLDPTSSPYAALGIQLRRSREARNLTQTELGEAISYSGAYISSVERGIRPPSRRFVEVVDAYLATGGTLALMLDQLEHSILIEGFPEYAEKEAEATAVRLFQIGVVSGLLQTADYATAYEQAFVRRGAVTQQQADERTRFLLARQERINRPSPPYVQAVLDEWSLRRPIGGSAVMVGQLAHLERLANQPNMTIQVAPLSLGENRPFAHPVTLLTMPNRSLLGYSETHQRGFLERDAETLADWAREYDRLQAEALPLAASLELIRVVRKGFESAP